MRRRIPILAITLFLLVPFGFCQSTPADCGFPQFPALSKQQNIFTEEQEDDLGAAMTAPFEGRVRVINDDSAAYLQEVAGRVLKGLPPTHLRFRFVLADLPEVNAFGFSGGRIYVTRKLVAFMRSEDELAAILAHEVGHQITHQSGIQVTRIFRDVLGVTSVGDRKDIFDKWNQVMETSNRKPHAFDRYFKEEDSNQLIADRVGIYLLARAGYRVAAFAEGFDRLAGTKGNTGGFFSDLFGITGADSKRLREMINRQDAPLPAGCVAAPPSHEKEFAAWQKKVIESNVVVREERVPGLERKVRLDPPLRSDLQVLLFSPDGKYVLAQDDASVYVLTREPFANHMRIEAPDAYPVKFSADSKSVSFITRQLRVETWDLEKKQRSSVHELALTDGCLQPELSPDGKYLACLVEEFDFRVLDTATQQLVFSKKHIYTPNSLAEIYALIDRIADQVKNDEPITIGTVAFSPDSRFVIAGRFGYGTSYDLQTKTEVKLPFNIKEALGTGFTFLGNDRVAGVDMHQPQKSKVMKFPSGDVLAEVPLARQSVRAAAKGDVLLLRPVSNYPVAAMDIATKKFVLGAKTPALDVYGNQFLSEQKNGDLGLYDLTEAKLLAGAALPSSELAGLRARAFSSDLSYVAVSQRSRGAVWSFDTGQRLQYVRGFRSGYFAGSGFVADFPKSEKVEREEVELGLKDNGISELYKIDAVSARQLNELMITTEPLKKGGRISDHATLTVRDPRSNRSLWSRTFEREVPLAYHSLGSDRMVLLFGDWEAMKAEAATDTDLAQRLAAMKDRKLNYLVEVVEVHSGKKLSMMVIDTGKLSFNIASISLCGERLLVTDTQNRVLVYDLAKGEIQSRMVGTVFAVNDRAGLALIQDQEGVGTLYNVATGATEAEFRFKSGIAAAQFHASSKALALLTLDQTVYRVDLEKAASDAAAEQAKQ